MIGADCPCGLRFQVADSLKGGIANCPACGKAVAVQGGPEPLFWILFAGGAAAVLGLAAAAWWQFGGIWGAIALGLGAAVMGLALIAA